MLELCCERVTGVDLLIFLTALQELILESCHNLVDEGLVPLNQLAALQTLILKSCSKLTDGSIPHLKTLTHLKKLDIVRCKLMSEEGIKQLDHLRIAGVKVITKDDL